jgi:hypothetical protein
MLDQHAHIFISYNHKDAAIARQVDAALIQNDFLVWRDISEIKPGDRIADRITEALTAADYYVLLISQSSSKSEWVRRELSLALELSQTKKLTLVPLLLDDASVPLELRGLLYIDLRKSVTEGIEHLVEFFRGQFSRVSELERRRPFRKSESQEENRRRGCENKLFELRLADLRYLLAARLSRGQFEVVWFDVFERRMVDETNVTDVSLCSVELVDRARREDRLSELIAMLCRNFLHL